MRHARAAIVHDTMLRPLIVWSGLRYGNSENARPARCCYPASPGRLTDRCRGPDDIGFVCGCTTISTVDLSQCRSATGLSRCRAAAAGIPQPRICSAGRPAAASTRGDPTAAWRRDGLAAGVLELGPTRLDLGVRRLCPQPVSARGVGPWSLDATTWRVGLDAGPLAMTRGRQRPSVTARRGSGRGRRARPVRRG
jgi:hypothetical protein